MDVTGDRSKVRSCKEQYCIGTWNVRSINQGKLEVVKQEMARVKREALRAIQIIYLIFDESGVVCASQGLIHFIRGIDLCVKSCQCSLIILLMSAGSVVISLPSVLILPSSLC